MLNSCKLKGQESRDIIEGKGLELGDIREEGIAWEQSEPCSEISSNYVSINGLYSILGLN